MRQIAGIDGKWIIEVGILLGYELGAYVDPDWDLMGTSASEGRVVNNLPIIGHFIFGLSSIYGSIFRKYHRSFITHFPGVSTSLRHLLLFGQGYFEIYRSSRDLAWLIMTFIGVFIGNSVSDAIHWYLDMKYKGSE